MDNNRFRVDEKKLLESLDEGINYNYQDMTQFYETYIN